MLDRVRGQLRGWKVERREGGPRARDGELTLSAEKGYLREVGNLVFHLSLVALLAAVAIGKLFGYEGQRIVVANGAQNSARPRPRRSTRSSPA